MAECIVGDIAPADNIPKEEKHRREEVSVDGWLHKRPPEKPIAEAKLSLLDPLQWGRAPGHRFGSVSGRGSQEGYSPNFRAWAGGCLDGSYEMDRQLDCTAFRVEQAGLVRQSLKVLRSKLLVFTLFWAVYGLIFQKQSFWFVLNLV